MRNLTAAFEVENLFRAVATARNRVLFLDYDGTLAPFVARRDQAAVYPGVPALLSEIGTLPEQRVVIVTGRGAVDVASRLPVTPRPTIWGSHGMERLDPDGRHWTSPVRAAARRAIDVEAERLEAALGTERVERKPVGLAVHVRGLPALEAAELIEGLAGPWRALAHRQGLLLRAFDGGLELAAGPRTKGDAVTEVLAELAGPVAAAFLGDDLTDEEGFRAMRGRGASVLVRPELRPTLADAWLRPPEELFAFLEAWRDAVPGMRAWA